MLVNFRNDDVRDVLDDSLIQITHIFTKNNVPLTFAVEPGNITDKVADWLINQKKAFPHLIEIVQHGYNHSNNVSYKKFGKNNMGEFGYGMLYKEQYDLIMKGKSSMNSYFGDLWFKAFVFPRGLKNRDSIKAIANAGYSVVTGSLHYSKYHQLLYAFGRLFNVESFLGRKISYNLKYRRKYDLLEIGTGISLIKSYKGYSDASFFDLITLQEKFLNYYNKNYRNVGILLHHRFHKDNDSFALLNDYIKWLKTMEGTTFNTLESIFEIYKKQ